MAAIGEVYLVRVRGVMGGQIAQNTYAYVTDEFGTPANVTAGALATSFLANVVPELEALQSVNFVYQDIYAYNLTNFDDFYTLTLTGDNGLVTGDAMPTYVAYGLAYANLDRRQRAGTKRIGGVPEVAVIDGDLNPAYGTQMADLCAALEASLLVGTAGHVDPGFLHIPTDASPYPNFSGTSAVTYKRITTQNTRKVGRGI